MASQPKLFDSDLAHLGAEPQAPGGTADTRAGSGKLQSR